MVEKTGDEKKAASCAALTAVQMGRCEKLEGRIDRTKNSEGVDKNRKCCTIRMKPMGSAYAQQDTHRDRVLDITKACDMDVCVMQQEDRIRTPWPLRLFRYTRVAGCHSKHFKTANEEE